MKKLLYIAASPKAENISVSKTVGREFINSFIKSNTDYTVEELDLYSEYIPEINSKTFTNRGEVASGDMYESLSQKDKDDVNRINNLCNQFLSADTYVISSPMWSVSFPARLKMYLDCIIINGRVISVSPKEVKGLLNNKERNMIYIQSSGGVYPKIIGWKLNYGIDYFHDIFKFLGIKKFEKILVQGTDMPEIGREKAIENAKNDIADTIERLSGNILLRI